MDDNTTVDNLSIMDNSTSSIELPSIIDEQSSKPFVPKIRIRLRPNSDQMKNNCVTNVYGSLIDKIEHEAIAPTKSIDNDYITENSETKCYKILEDSGGGGCGDCTDTTNEVKHSYMLHGINLRTRVPKPLTLSKKLKTNERKNADDKRQISYQTEKEFKPHCVKNPYKSYILNSSKNQRRKEKCGAKSVAKVRNEIFGNINLKEIVNQENFFKLSPDIQWQLANLLPNCDKPKSSDNQNSNCHCSDFLSTNSEHQKVNPNVSFNALNNEFIGKALTKYSLKMGQSDLINLLTSERENLRSRPMSMLNDDLALIDPTDDDINDIKIEETDKHNNAEEENDDMKHLDDNKSNSSVCTTETMEMNCTGNLFENLSLKMEQYQNIEAKFVESCDINYFIGMSTNHCDVANETSSTNEKDLVMDSQCDNARVVNTNRDSVDDQRLSIIDENVSLDQSHEIQAEYKHLTQHLSIDTDNTSNLFDEKRRKRGRKRKCVNASDEVLVVPVKRSNRSTAGKRPARLDSESPPPSPNITPNTDKKINNNKLKKQKESNRNKRKCKMKHDNSSDELDAIVKAEVKSKKHPVYHDVTKYRKNCSSSPESLPTESDLSPLSKPSPNGSSLLGSFCRSSLGSLYNDKKTSNHVNSVQALSPSWSCTSESTTPSVKSDYGHFQPTKTSPTLVNMTSGNIDIKPSIEPESKSIQGMPPPRQTLTLAAMREKMRAKKLAKEDKRKDSSSNYKKSSSANYPKNKRQSAECSSLLKEGDDDFQLMDKMISSSEEFDELLNNSQDSLLEFFMGEDNYDFETTPDHCSNINACIKKPNNVKKSMSKVKSFSEETFIKDPVIPNNFTKIHSNKENNNGPRISTNHQSKILINKSSSNPSSNDSTQSGKSIADTIATVLQKLNSSKENGLVINNNSSSTTHCSASKTSVPNAYLVDGNGLSTALSFIQSLNPGAKVTTQQFYLVNSGPQLILQPSPPANVLPEKLSSLTVPNKVSLAPKIANQPSIVRQPSTVNDGFSMALNQLTFNQSINDKPINMTPESLNLLRNSCLKMPISSESTNSTYMMSPITHNVPVNQTNSLHLQTISTPHPIGLVHSVQPPLPSLFSSQLRFVHPSSLTNQSNQNTISLIGSNIPSSSAPISNTNQAPKLLFLCPTVAPANQSSLVTSPNVLNQEQKYLLLSKQPDKQATIQLVSSQGLWQQLNPTMISQANNLLVMQPQPINTSFESLLCANPHSVNDSRSTTLDSQQISLSNFGTEPMKSQYISSVDATTSSLIIDSRSLVAKLSQLSNEDTTRSSGSSTNHILPSNTTLSQLYSADDSKQIDATLLKQDNNSATNNGNTGSSNQPQSQDISQS